MAPMRLLELGHELLRHLPIIFHALEGGEELGRGDAVDRARVGVDIGLGVGVLRGLRGLRWIGLCAGLGLWVLGLRVLLL